MKKLLISLFILATSCITLLAAPDKNFEYNSDYSTTTRRGTKNICGDIKTFPNQNSTVTNFEMVAGSITKVSTVDGRDVSADGAALDALSNSFNNKLDFNDDSTDKNDFNGLNVNNGAVNINTYTTFISSSGTNQALLPNTTAPGGWGCYADDTPTAWDFVTKLQDSSDSTYIQTHEAYGAGDGWLFAMDTPTIDPIEVLGIRIVVRATGSSAAGGFRTTYRSGGTNYYSSNVSVSAGAAVADYTVTYATNPKTGVAWTMADLTPNPAAYSNLFGGEFWSNSGGTWSLKIVKYTIYIDYIDKKTTIDGGNFSTHLLTTYSLNTSTSNVTPRDTTVDLGSSSKYWNNVHYHSLVSHSLKYVNLSDATKLIKGFRKNKTNDYINKKSLGKAYIKDGVNDGEDMNTVISALMTINKNLLERIEALEQEKKP